MQQDRQLERPQPTRGGLETDDDDVESIGGDDTIDDEDVDESDA